MATAKLVQVKLQQVWPHEAQDFTPWLVENLDELSDVVPFELVEAQKEQSAGSSYVDIVATTSDGDTVIIENQLKLSDHDHLGKVLTYLAAYEAKAAIWIVAEARPEHVNAITWLNKLSDTDFYLIKVSAVRIGDSQPAPMFTLLTGPGPVLEDAGKKKKQASGKKAKLKEESYFQSLTALNKPDLVDFAAWVLDNAGTLGLTVEWGKLGPMLKYQDPKVGKCALGRVRVDGRLGLGTASLFIACKKHGLPLEIARDYMDGLASMIPGARRVVLPDVKWGESESLRMSDDGGVAGLPPLEPLAANREAWFALIGKTIKSIQQATKE